MVDVVGSGELIHRQAEVCQKVVEDALENKTGVKDVLEKLREVGATPMDSDYGWQYTDWLEAGSQTPGTDSNPIVQEASSEGHNEDH